METFEKIYNDNYEAMFRVARKMVYDGDVVSDIVQEVFIYFFDKVNRGEKVRYPKSWLYRATYNKCIDYWREKKRFETIDLIEASRIEDEDNDNSAAKAALNLALDRLKPDERFLVVLYSEGLSYKEMAEVTEIKITSVGKTLSRILKKIEIELKCQCDELYN
ncbi:RNA polymerase sigma factor [Ancylomarina sp.]|uniref:RNA polymerase sigma factor n=1 Tax=Ancylomarina sp. TaxID=1970196 RepID=UPI0035658F11